MSSKQPYYISSNSYSKKNRLICVVCGSVARGNNFGVITCMSCKMFFRRNALASTDQLYCRYKGNCQISPRTRRCCSYCRLHTCFRMGMRKDFIRKKKKCSQSSIDAEQPIQRMHPEFIRPLDLLQWSDRSQLSNNDWSVLRHLSSIVESLNDRVISKANEIHQHILFIGNQPLKVRLKASYIYDMVNIFTDVGLEFIKFIPQFISLPSVNQQALLMRNRTPVVLFQAYYQLNLKPVQYLTQTSYWKTSMECLFLSSTKHMHDEINYLVGHISFTDPYLIKLVLVILAFSTNNIDHDEITLTHQLDEYYHAFILHQVQNIYVELMWKYMIHQFGEQRAIYLFSDIINTILQVQTVVFAIDNSEIPFEQKFNENIVKITDQTLRLIFEN